MATQTSLLQEILPHFDVSAVYSVRIKSDPEQIYAVLQKGIPTGTLTKWLMMLRKLPRFLRKEESCTVQEDPFYKLKQVENQEIVIGIIGRFWLPVSDFVFIENLEQFLDFQDNGWCKAALNLRIVPDKPGECIVTTETRVIGYGSAKEHFRKYWQFIGPFSGLIRKEILRNIRKASEKPVASV